MGCMHVWGGTCSNCVTSVRLEQSTVPVLVNWPDSPRLEDAAPVLADQMSDLVGYFPAAIKELRRLLADEQQVAAIMGGAASRIVTGFVEYGDEMFTWDETRLKRELREELEDALVYTSRLMKLIAAFEDNDAQG